MFARKAKNIASERLGRNLLFASLFGLAVLSGGREISLADESRHGRNLLARIPHSDLRLLLNPESTSEKVALRHVYLLGKEHLALYSGPLFAQLDQRYVSIRFTGDTQNAFSSGLSLALDSDEKGQASFKANACVTFDLSCNNLKVLGQPDKFEVTHEGSRLSAKINRKACPQLGECVLRLSSWRLTQLGRYGGSVEPSLHVALVDTGATLALIDIQHRKLIATLVDNDSDLRSRLGHIQKVELLADTLVLSGARGQLQVNPSRDQAFLITEREVGRAFQTSSGLRMDSFHWTPGFLSPSEQILAMSREGILTQKRFLPFPSSGFGSVMNGNVVQSNHEIVLPFEKVNFVKARLCERSEGQTLIFAGLATGNSRVYQAPLFGKESGKVKSFVVPSESPLESEIELCGLQAMQKDSSKFKLIRLLPRRKREDSMQQEFTLLDLSIQSDVRIQGTQDQFLVATNQSEQGCTKSLYMDLSKAVSTRGKRYSKVIESIRCDAIATFDAASEGHEVQLLRLDAQSNLTLEKLPSD